ncbi:ZIP zinc transporter-domain-containing protein [Lasiosphaeris hirsuta]|uniref:ZIP zinc transporter-domain-containing protein n=1 Tax=Lasiosphaeris hirsuta TaxID=260670 RepID=A0AA40DIA3_9PEZI|nr:ZIP zinc transporter-domain-containing protein [Lasiosphaeris hirsuta]
MNRPSWTDDDFDHPTWNQNPPSLASDLTTCQDMNGIANARVQRSRCAGSGAFGLLDEKQLGERGGVSWLDPRRRLFPVPAANGHFLPFVASRAALGGEGQARSSHPSQPWGWIGWMVSVVVVSTVISFVRSAFRSPLSFSSASAGVAAELAVQGAGQAESTIAHRLLKRQDRCITQTGSAGAYNTPLHVGALLIILGVSSFACALPLLAARFPIIRIPKVFFFGVRHFGTGVLLATAFVHLLPTAFISLGNPCLSSFWNTDYPAMPGAIALFGIFFVSVIEMIFSPARQFTPRTRNGRGGGTDAGKDQVSVGHSAIGHCGHADVVASITRSSSRPDRGSIEPAPVREVDVPSRQSLEEAVEEGSHGHILTPEQQHKKAILQCMLLEVGILFHSVFIGMALSIAVGGDFIVLLIAIAFHQSFEGLALGARIAAIDWPDKSWQPYLMVLAYGCTTPIGQAIGLATHTLYDPNSEFGLVLVGTMNAVSSGLLVFASLIELLAEDFLSDHSWVVMRGRKRVAACCLVLLGAVLMSLVGAWA